LEQTKWHSLGRPQSGHWPGSQFIVAAGQFCGAMSRGAQERSVASGREMAGLPDGISNRIRARSLP
jgi:hypothetical protein